MLYIVRLRMKESTTGADLGPVNRRLDEEVLPALEQVGGVRWARAYNSITGEIAIILDIENTATIDRILTDQGTAAAVGTLLQYTTRSGGEILYDRPAWQRIYGNR